MQRNVSKRFCLLVAVVLAGLSLSLSGPLAQTPQDPYPQNAIVGYRKAGDNDAVARLQRQINDGTIKLEFAEGNGYLAAVLKALRIPVASQGLVFSKTSLQFHRITPRNPRAIYFNDEVYVGWVRGGDILEVAAVDPQRGGVFYMLEQRATSKPRFVRNDDCLQCHQSNATHEVPGFMVRSVYPDERGNPIAALGSHISNQRSPLAQRWGGWYVTGTHGAARHAGNLLFREDSQPDKPEQLTGANVTKLDDYFFPASYLSAQSDIVALLVLEHQTEMHNRITKLHYETQAALQPAATTKEAAAPTGLTDAADARQRLDQRIDQRIQQAARALVRDLLFAGEARWQTPISGTTDFAKMFAAAGPRDRRGRSLRQLDLRTKLFRYPCSYLIYSAAFDALPPPALAVVYQQLWQALKGQTADQELLAIPAAERRAVLEILRATKTKLPAYFYRS